MKLQARHEYEYPLELVLQTTHHDIVNNIESFKETLDLKDARRIHYAEHPDGRQDVEFSVCVHKNIPPLAQAVIKPHMLTWRQVSRWDPSSLSYTFEIIPYFMRETFFCKGVWKYEKQNGKVIHSMDGQLNVKIPIIGNLVEQAISKELSKSQQRLHAKHLQKLKELSKTSRVDSAR